MFLANSWRRQRLEAVTDTRDQKPGQGSDFAVAETRPLRTRLAHWPPPFRNGQSQPKIIRHQPGEKPRLAKPRGWRLTRATFSEFSDD
jgi:hypothetical protein